MFAILRTFRFIVSDGIFSDKQINFQYAEDNMPKNAKFTLFLMFYAKVNTKTQDSSLFSYVFVYFIEFFIYFFTNFNKIKSTNK